MCLMISQLVHDVSFNSCTTLFPVFVLMIYLWWRCQQGKLCSADVN